MSLYAVSDIGDAVEATKRFLVPVRRDRWLGLAVVVFFVGGVGITAPTSPVASPPPNAQVDPGLPSLPEQLPGPLPSDPLVLGAAVAVAAVALWLALTLVESVMEFVFVAALRDESVRLRRFVGEHWRLGVRLFAFRVVVAALAGAVVAAVGFTLATDTIGGSPTTWTLSEGLRFLALVGPVAGVVYALVALVNGFTTSFVVPVMLAEDRSVLGGWRRFWPTLTGQLVQYGAYLALAFVVGIAVSVITATATAVGAVLLAIPFLLVAGLLVAVVGVAMSGAVLAVFAVLALVYVGLVLTLLAFVQVPLRTFTRYYTLFVLGDTNGEFDVVADARAAVRETTPADRRF